MQPQSQTAKKKKILIAAGIFALPVIAITIALIALVSPHKKPSPKRVSGSAFNTDLPSPNLPKGEKNKLEIYMQAQQDSIKKNQERAKDPFANISAAKTTGLSPDRPLLEGGSSARPPSSAAQTAQEDENEKKVSERVQRIYAALRPSAPADRPGTSTTFSAVDPQGSPDVERLEKMMANLQQKDTATDPRLRQVKEVLDQIMAIKNPDRNTSSNIAAAAVPTALPVTGTAPKTAALNEIDDESSTQNGFYGLSDEPDSATIPGGSLEAVIHSSQTIQTGSIVKLRLLQPIYVGGELIAANSFIYGPATITGERVTIQLTNAICSGRIFPISMKVYDGTDGLEGLYVPGLITRDVVKQNMSQGVSAMNFAALDPSLGAQAAAAGIETARSLLSRKITLIKATLKAGHIAILKPAGNH